MSSGAAFRGPLLLAAVISVGRQELAAEIILAACRGATDRSMANAGATLVEHATKRPAVRHAIEEARLAWQVLATRFCPEQALRLPLACVRESAPRLRWAERERWRRPAAEVHLLDFGVNPCPSHRCQVAALDIEITMTTADLATEGVQQEIQSRRAIGGIGLANNGRLGRLRFWRRLGLCLFLLRAEAEFPLTRCRLAFLAARVAEFEATGAVAAVALGVLNPLGLGVSLGLA